MANRIQLRRDTSANWNRVNPVLEDGEPGLDITTNQIKYGDGSSTWTELEYASGGSSTSLGNLTIGENAETIVSDNGDTFLNFNGADGGKLVIGSNADKNLIVSLNENNTAKEWEFGTDGNLTLPSGGRINYANGTSILNGITSGSTYSNANVASYLPTYSGNIAGNIVKGGKTWTFGTDGNTAIPGNVTIGSGYGNISMVHTISANNYVYANGVSILANITGGASTGNITFNGPGIGLDAGTTSAPDTYINISPTDEGWAFLQLPNDITANVRNTRLWNGAGNVEIGSGDFSHAGDSYTWIFNKDGNLTLPTGGTIGAIETADSVDLYGDANVQYVQLNWNNQNFVYADSQGAHMQAGPTSPGQYEIFLAVDGTTTFPDHKNVTITGNLTVGNLLVNGNSTIINTVSYSVEDNVIQIAAGNPADTLDIGFVGHRTVNSTLQHTGLVRDASAGSWKLFSNVVAQPGTTVDFSDAVLDDLELGTLYSTLVNTNNLTANLVSTLNLHITSATPTATGAAGDKAGDIRVDSDYVYYCTTDYAHDSGTYYTTLTAEKIPYDAYKIQIAKASVFGTPVHEPYGNGATAWAVTFVGGPTGYVDQVPVSSGNDWILDLSATPSVFGVGTPVTITNPNPTPDPVIWKRIALNAFTETAAKFAANGVLYLPNSSYIEPSSTSINWGVQGSFNLLTNDASSVTTHKWAFGDNGKITKTYGGSAANLTLTSNSNDLILTTTGNLIIPGNINYANGVSILAGLGGGSSSNYSNANVASYLPTYSGNVTASYFIGNLTNSTGNVYTVGNAVIGVSGYTVLPTTIAQFTGNANTYAQLNIQNISSGTASTTEIVATANNGTDSIFFVDLGIAGNTYNVNAPANSLGTAIYANDAYLYAQGNTSATVGGNLAIGASTLGKTVKLFAGGINSANVIATVSATGVLVIGNVTATGNIVANTITGAVANANTTITAGTYTTTFDTNGNVTAQGNVVANYLFGNGAFLTGVVTSGGSSNYANANVAVFLSSFGSNSISTTGNVAAGNVTATGNVTAAYIVTTGGYGNITQVDTITANTAAVGNVTINGVRTTRVISRNVAKGSGYANIDNVSFRMMAGGYAQVSTISSTYDAFWSWRQVFTSNSSSGTFTGATLTTTYSNIGNPTLMGSGGDTLEVMLYGQTGTDVYRVTFLQMLTAGNATIIAERVA
jgi:hypothetical protein